MCIWLLRRLLFVRFEVRVARICRLKELFEFCRYSTYPGWELVTLRIPLFTWMQAPYFETAYFSMLDILRQQLCKCRHGKIGHHLNVVEDQLCYEPAKSDGSVRSIASPLLCSLTVAFVGEEHFVKTWSSNSRDSVDIEAMATE